MADTDLSKLKKKKRVAVSLSLDEENLNWLKEDIEKYGDGIPLSSVFDMLLRSFKKQRTEMMEDKAKETKPMEEEDGDKSDIKD